MKAKLPILCAMLALTAQTSWSQAFTVSIKNDTNLPIIFNKHAVWHNWNEPPSCGKGKASDVNLLNNNYDVIANDFAYNESDFYVFSLWVPKSVGKSTVTYARLNCSFSNFFRMMTTYKDMNIACGWKKINLHDIMKDLKSGKTKNDVDLFTKPGLDSTETGTSVWSIKLDLYFKNIDDKILIGPSLERLEDGYTVPGSEKTCFKDDIKNCFIGWATTTPSTTQRFQNTENKSILVKKQQ